MGEEEVSPWVNQSSRSRGFTDPSTVDLLPTRVDVHALRSHTAQP